MVRNLKIQITALAGLLAMTAGLAAQSKTITGETETITATVESIDRSNRTLTLKSPDGTYKVVNVPDDVQRFAEINVGDKITGRYYENVTVRLKAPGEKDIDSATQAVTPGTGARPAGTAAVQRAITATITQLDAKTPSITFEGPNGWSYSTRIRDKKVLDQIKVGDKVDITWTAAAMVSVEAPK
jgi:Cu/Ag efflux protein CusF